MLRSLSTRRTLPVALLAAGALFLSGCGGDDAPETTDDPSSSPSASETPSDDATGIADTDGDGCADFKADGLAKTVTVAGKAGAAVTATFDKPLKATELERSVITEGTGAATAKGQEINTQVTAFKGSDGSSLGSQALKVTVGDSSQYGAFAAGAECVAIGSRVVVTVPAADVYGASGNAQAGIEGTDSLVIVTDVLGKVVPLKPAVWNDPRVKVAFGGATPKLTLPPGAPSQKLQMKILKQGTGKVVGKNDQVTVDYQGTNWRTKKIFDQSYGQQPATFSPTGVVEGFGAALIGQKVGTQLVVTIPAKYGYGTAGNSQAGINGTDVLVFVLEIKSTVAG